jgi:hypothetical protein
MKAMSTPSRMNGHVSASDFEILSSAYRKMVGNTKLDEALARRRARELVIELTGAVEIDDDLILRIIRR